MLSKEIRAIYEKSALDRREMILGHLEQLKSVDRLKMSISLDELGLADYVQKERLAVLNLCLPEAKEKAND
tara:strand:+ start:26 stop:238 length:213 start_codon:yes stop_codon:yes gene_type:complete